MMADAARMDQFLSQWDIRRLDRALMQCVSERERTGDGASQ